LTDSQIDNFYQGWRTRYGTGTGNGLFVIGATNKYLDFDEGGAELTATMAVADTYNGQTLADNIEYWLNAEGALTYTVTYDETTGKFTIAASGNFTLRWNTGTHKANSIATTIGFSDAADDTGAATYTADLRRIHYPSEGTGWLDAGAAVALNYIELRGHNLSSAAVITLYGADDSSGTNLESQAITWTTGNILQFFAAITKRFWALTIADPTNPVAYLEVKTIVLGPSWELSRNYNSQYEHGADLFSMTELSDSIVSFGQEKPSPQSWALNFKGLTDASAVEARALIEECQTVHGFVICTNPTAPTIANTYFVINTAAARPQHERDDYWNWALAVREIE